MQAKRTAQPPEDLKCKLVASFQEESEFFNKAKAHPKLRQFLMLFPTMEGTWDPKEANSLLHLFLILDDTGALNKFLEEEALDA